MVLYFSGTGNSRYAARMIANMTGDETTSMNALIKKGARGSFISERPYVFVCPTYAWRLPRIVEKLIKEATLAGHKQAYFVLTCGGEPGNAARYAKRLCEKKGLVFMGLAGVVMPENYVALFDVPDKRQADAIIEKAIPQIREIAGHIKKGAPLPQQRITLVDRLKSGIVNDAFYPLIVKAKGFYATGGCTGCGRCAALCPLNNIRLADGRPQWGDSCTHCMACICSCPFGAIEYKNASKGKPRYYNSSEPPQ